MAVKVRKFESPRDLAAFAKHVEGALASFAAANAELHAKLNEVIAGLNASTSAAAGERLGTWPGVNGLS